MANEGKFNADLDMGFNITVDSSALTDLTKTIKEIAKGKDLQRYWSDVESATERAIKAAKRYSDRQNSKGAASNFLKDFNALKAMVGGKNISELFPELDVNELLKNAKQIAPEINSAFSVNTFSQAFKTFNVLKEKGYDLEEVFSKLADYVNLRKENFDLSRENFNYKDLLGDRDIEQLDNQVKEIKKLRNQAEGTFTKFLDINNISTTDYFGEDRFTEYFEGIRNGTMTASDAIKKFKERYDYLLEDNFRLSGDSFGIDQLQAFSEKLESIFLQVQETSNKINDIISNGIITKSVSDLSNDSSITSTQRSLFGNLLEDEESLKSITSLFQKLIEETNKTSNTQLFDTEQFTKITSLFETIESHLSSLRKVISDVGDGDEFSPLLSTIKEINSAIDSLNNTVKNTNFETSLNLDFGDIGGKYDEQLSKAQRRKMLAYKKLFDDMRSTGKVTKESWKFVEPEGLSDDELSGIYKQMIEREKTVRGSNVFKRVIDENSKEIKNAQAAVNRARKNTENNNNLQEILGFEKTDLTGVISQLEMIANKLDTIASSAKTMGDAFSSGLNVSASFEEITKLTERVKELEAELQKVKSVGGISGNKTDLSSGGSKTAGNNTNQVLKEQENLLDEVIKKGEKARDIISQVGKRELSHVVEKDDTGKIVSEYDQGEYSFTERLQDGQLQRVLVTYNNETKEWEETVLSISTAFEKVGNEVIKLDNQINKLELSRDKTLSQHPGYDTSADDKLIALAEKRRTVLESTLSLYAKEPEYEYESVKFEERRRENNEKILALKEKQANVQQVKSDEATAKAEEKKIQAQTQAAQKSAEAQAKVEAKRQEQLAKAKAAALSKSRQNAKNETQTSVNNAVKKQLESWREIQKIRLQMSKTTDTGELSRLEAMKKVEQERYLDATKILNINRELYDYEAQSYKLQKASKDTTNAIATKRNKEISSQIEAAQKFQSTLKTSSNGGYFPSESYNKVVTITNQKLTEMVALRQKINSEQNGVATAEQAKKMSDLYEDILKQQKTLQSLTSSQKGSTSLKNEKAIDRINKALDQNTRMSAEAKAQLRAYIAELQSNPAANVEEITAAWMGVVRAEKEAGRGGKSIFSAIGEKAFYGLAGQIAGMVSLWDVINVLKQAAAEVVNINSAFTDLSKVSDISLDNLESQLSDFSDIAKDVGATITDTIDATSNWSRNGYNLADSKELAKVSLIYKNVGDGIDIDEADSSLVSTLQGFNLQASDAMSVIDRFNEVSNNFAIDSGGIGEALQRSAASFNAANTDLSKSIALITGTNVTLQDPERVGNMWKTVSARLRGAESELIDMGEDTDGMVESTSKLREIIKGMTGFDIMADKAGTQFKDIYDIVVGIGEKWQDLNDIDRASLLEKLAGKNQSNALAAALNNVQTIKDAYQTAENSTGSAMQEQSRYEQSIKYSIDRIKASAQQLAATSFKSSFLKGLVDTGNAAVEVITKLIDKVGILGTALGGVGIFSFIKNLDLFITKLVTSYIRIQRKWFCKQMCVVTF